jgi:hypothetical protein
LRVKIVDRGGPSLQLLRALLQHLEIDCEDGKPDEMLIEVRPLTSGAKLLEVDGLEVVRTRDSGLILGGIYQALLQRLHPDADLFALIHGGAVAFDGRGLGLPGASGSGKSTLVAALVAEGFSYCADDLLALGAPRGTALRWPVPLSLKSGSWAVLRSYYPDIENAPAYRSKGFDARLIVLPDEVWHEPALPLAAFVFPNYQDGAELALERLEPFEALALLLNDRIWLGWPLQEQRVRRFLDWFGTVPHYRLTFGSLPAATQALRSLLTR